MNNSIDFVDRRVQININNYKQTTRLTEVYESCDTTRNDRCAP